ncbi:S-layer homology domain-containing protein [Candidatus Peregrinibacteria bacterium]|nr:S-layer homology domain-containing protein [Candidatus Peregrinibacteria bacterium]
MSPWTPRRIGIIGIVALLLSQSVAFTSRAAVFPDVPDGRLYQEEIEFLVGMQVINGNPDGTFSPLRNVNRAEMLKMLYRVAEKTPDPAGRLCFPDVQPGSWYEPFVCDAAKNHYVEGYSDGTFRPDRPVSRVEAIKMITTVLGIPVPELSQRARDVVKFVDVSFSAWYTKYLYLAFTRGILPIDGQDGPRFYPDKPLLRGEAAAYIYQALHLQEEEESIDDVVASSSSASSVMEVERGTSSFQMQQESSKSLAAGPLVKDAHLPLKEDGVFPGKQAVLYRFVLTASRTLRLQVSLAAGGQQGKITCRLYRLEEQGFSMEYYLGFEEQGKCVLRVALSAGSYQWEVRPSERDTLYTAEIADAVGDGNDGFREAKTIGKAVPRVGVLEVGDTADWYKFAVASEGDTMLQVSSAEGLSCLVYPMGDVDLYGFSGPQCNESYRYPVGTYYVGVVRSAGKSGSAKYTVQWK